MTSAVTKIEPAIDWITTTWNKEQAGSDDNLKRTLEFERQVYQNGNTQEVHVWQGFYGRKTGSLFIGERTGDYIVRASGSLAHQAFTSIYRPGMHVSRLDVAVTIWLLPHNANVGLSALSEARLTKMAGKAKNPATITHYESDDGGFTLYIGKRTSRVYARLYNKEAESKEQYYEGAWRYECELKNATATETAQELYYSLFPFEETISSLVWRWWRSKGVTPLFDTFAQGLEIVLPRREETTIERSLRWLEEQVKPTVAKLSALGYTSDVLAALGLPGADIGHLD